MKTLFAFSLFLLVRALESRSLSPLLVQAPPRSNQRCIQPSNESHADYTPVIFSNCTGSRSQEWLYSNHLISVFGDKCLAVPRGRSEDGVQLQIVSCNKHDANQRFDYNPYDDNRITWVNSDKCVDWHSTRVIDGSPVRLSPCFHQSTHGMWGIGRIASSLFINPHHKRRFKRQEQLVAGQHTIQHGSSSTKCLTATSDTVGAKVVVKDCIGDSTQVWGRDGQNIRVFMDKCLAIPSTKPAAGQKLQVATCSTDDDPTQDWMTAYPHLIQLAKHNLCLESVAGNDTTEIFVELANCSGTNADQVWKLAPNCLVGVSTQTSLGFGLIEATAIQLQSIAKHSWEIGVTTQALIDLLYPTLSPFAANAQFPPPGNVFPVIPDIVNAIAENVVAKKPKKILALFDEGAVGDPASVGIAVMMANYTRTDLSDTSLGKAVDEQFEFLVQKAPKSSSGAISQRTKYVQYWTDFVNMAPPFIAFYGAMKNNHTILQMAYDQCRLYRQELRDPTVGLWRHIMGGPFQELSFWATGNGWAAMGMLRVLATIRASSFADQMKSQQTDLIEWTREIIQNTWKYQKTNGTLYNHLNDPKSFADSSSTALMAASTYRFALLTSDTAFIPNADLAMSLIKNSLDPMTGFLRNVVDPMNFKQRGSLGQGMLIFALRHVFRVLDSPNLGAHTLRRCIYIVCVVFSPVHAALF